MNKYKWLIKSCFKLLFCMYIFSISGNLTSINNNRDRLEDPFRKILISLISDSDEFQYKSIIYYFIEFYTLFCGSCLFFAVCYLFINNKISILSELFTIEIIGISLNAIVQVSTLLPDSNSTQEICLEQRKLGYWVLTRISSQFCGDMIWSGHIFHIQLCLYFIWRAFNKWLHKKLYTFISVFSVLIISICIILVRTHYTVDIELSIIVFTLLASNEYILDKFVPFIYSEYKQVIL